MRKYIPVKNVTLACNMNMPAERRCTEHPHWCELKVGGVHNVRCESGMDINKSMAQNQAMHAIRKMKSAIQALIAGAEQSPDKIFMFMAFFSSITAIASALLLREISGSFIGILTAWCLFIFGVGIFLSCAYCIASIYFLAAKLDDAYPAPKSNRRQTEALRFLCGEKTDNAMHCKYRTTLPQTINVSDWHTP